MKDKELSIVDVYKAIESHLQEKDIKYLARRLNGSIDLKINNTRIVIYENQIMISWKMGTTSLPLTEYSVEFIKKELNNVA